MQTVRSISLSNLNSFHFSCLIPVTFNTMLNGSGNSRRLCLVPDLRRNASRFSLLRILLTVSLSHMIYIMWMYIPFMLILLRVFFLS